MRQCALVAHQKAPIFPHVLMVIHIIRVRRPSITTKKLSILPCVKNIRSRCKEHLFYVWCECAIWHEGNEDGHDGSNGGGERDAGDVRGAL